MVAVCALVVGLLWAAVASMQTPTALDDTIARWAADLPEGIRPFLRAVTTLGASLTVGILLAVVAAVTFAKDRSVMVPVFFAVVLAGEILLTNAIKGIVDRARPAFDQVVDTTGSSYPSGHSAAAAAAYAAIALVLSRGRPPAVRRWLLAGAVVIAIMVAASRVMLGVHWFTDVVGGLAFGWGWVTACALLILARPARERLDETEAQKELTPQ